MIRSGTIGILVLTVAFLLACGESSDEPDLNTVCAEACEGIKKCEEAEGHEVDAEQQSECIAGCESGGNMDTKPTAAQIQACVDAHLASCDGPGFGMCVASSGGTGTAGNDMVLFMTLFQSVCEKRFECCGPPSSENMIQTVDECSGLFAGFMMMGIQPGQDAGYLEIDSANLAQCKEALDTAMAQTTCDDDLATSSEVPSLGLLSCNDFMIGKQQEGEVCSYQDPDDPDAMKMSSDEYCVEGLVCSRVEDEDDKMCIKGLEEGVECEGHFGAKCADGLVCGPDDTCIEPQADGAVCSDDDHCDSRECSAFGVEGECVPKDSDACGDW